MLEWKIMEVAVALFIEQDVFTLYNAPTAAMTYVALTFALMTLNFDRNDVPLSRGNMHAKLENDTPKCVHFRVKNVIL